MTDAETLRYLDDLRGRVRLRGRPDPTVMTLPEIDAYTQRLADENNAQRERIARMARTGGLNSLGR